MNPTPRTPYPQKTTMMLLGITALSAACSGTDMPGGEAELDTVAHPIADGSTNWSGLSFQRNRTVSIRTRRDWCSGTLLLPDVVLTARHCITADGSVDGEVPTDAHLVSVRMRDLAPILSSSCTAPSCVHATELVGHPGGPDIALIHLEAPLSHPEAPVPFTPLELSSDVIYRNEAQLLSTGWGYGTCSNNLALRHGSFVVSSLIKSVTVGDVPQSPVMVLKGAQEGQSIAPGDSGGPTWGWQNALPSVVGVHTGGICPREGWDVRVYLYLQWIESTLASFESRSQALYSLSSLSEVEFETTDSNANWRIHGSRLQQTNNADANFALVRGEVFQQVGGPSALAVRVQGGDNDTSGIVFHYYDPQRYLACRANQQASTLELVRVNGGATTVLASTNWPGDYSDEQQIIVSTQRQSVTAYQLLCAVTGGSITRWVVASNDPSFSAGRVGIYNRYNDDVYHSDFTITF